MSKLKEIRVNKKMTLKDVAEGAGTSIQQIQRLEKGERRLTTDWIRRLSKALECKPAEIVPEFAMSYEQKERELIGKINRLEEREKEIVEDFVHTLLQKKEEE